MTLVMAEKNQPMFRDFLGLGHTDEVKQVGYTSSDAIHVSRTSPEFDSEGDGETMATRASSGTSGRFKTSSVPGGLVSPSFCLALPSSSDPGSGKLGYIFVVHELFGTCMHFHSTVRAVWWCPSL